MNLLRLIICTILFLLASQTSAKTLLVLGDSLSAAFGIDQSKGWVALLEQQLRQRGDGEYRVINASTSGDTSGSGLARLPKLLSTHNPDIVVVELGGNDGLRGYPIKLLNKNLSQIITLSQESGAKVLLLGIQIPPNYGARYTDSFTVLYAELAKKYHLPLVPFFMDQVGSNKNLMQTDGIHPKAEAQPLLLKNVMPYLLPLL